MTDHPSRETAKIYQFPIRPRTQKTRSALVAKPADARTPNYPRTDSGSGWYHDAAIREAEQHCR